MGKGFKNNLVTLIDHSSNTEPAMYGKEQFINSITEQGASVEKVNYWTQTSEECCIVIGTTNDRFIEKLLDDNGAKEYRKPESTIYWWCNTGKGSALVIAGSDDRGLLYALLEMAEQIKYKGIEALGSIQNNIESPDTNIRSVSRFVMSHRDDDWFYSEEFWNYYFKRLAGYRYNRFVLILGFDTAYLSPPYPFFVKVPGYPGVKAVGLSDEERDNNLKQLRRVGQLCRKYGLEYNLATWQQTPWTSNQSLLVEGLAKNEDELGNYCAAGLKELLIQCEEIEVLQLRVNHEAGVGDQNTNEIFWKKLIAATSEVSRKVKLDLRAKGLTDGMIQYALEKGLQLAVPTKHWCEHIALPYHLSEMRNEELTRLYNLNHSRRYSYADMLRRPRSYDTIYRLWNYGSNTLFLFGDPDYARRFTYSINYGQAVGYEITAPLTLKGGMSSIKGEPWSIFDDSELMYSKWEDERYWAWYLVFGRLGYSMNTCPDVWKREFRAHFGSAAPHVEDALRSGSKVLPLVTSFHMPVHPSLQYWTEICTGAALFGEHNYNTVYKDITYQNVEPSDPGLFYRISDYVEDVLNGSLKGKYSPLQIREWLNTLVSDIRESVKKAEESCDLSENREYKAAKVDLALQAGLAEYHAMKIKAALELSYYEKTNDINHLKEAYKYAVKSRDCWKSLCETGSAYHYNLEFSAGAGSGIGKRGHWKDRLPELEKDVEKLKEMLGGCEVEAVAEDCCERHSSLPSLASDVPEVWNAGESLVVNVKCGEMNRFKGLKMHYRHMNQLEGKFIEISMEKTDNGYRGVIPAEYITPEWDIMIYFSGIDNFNEPFIYPGLYNPEYLAPYHVVKIISK